MSFIDRINFVAELSARFCIDGLVQSAITLLVVSLVWRMIHKRAASQLGYWLFLLVLLKPFVPIQVMVPDPRSIGQSASAPATSTAVGVVTSLEHQMMPIAAVESPAEDKSQLVVTTPYALLMLTWLLVVVMGFLRLLCIQMRTCRMIRSSIPATSAERLEFDELVKLAGIRRGTRLLWNDSLTSPVAACASSPCIVIPRHLTVLLSRQQLRWTMLHELAHVRRGDLWIMLFQNGVRTVLFFNPAVWIACYIMDQLREQSCDAEATARSSISPTEAGRGFLKIVEFSGSDERVLALGFHNTHRHIRSRMMRLIQANRGMSYRLTLPAKIALVTVALVVLPSVKAQEDSKDVSIRARIAALEAELQVLKGAVSETESESDAKASKKKKSHIEVRELRLQPHRFGEVHAVESHPSHSKHSKVEHVTVDLTHDASVFVREKQLTGHHGTITFGHVGGNNVSLGNHKAKIEAPGEGKQKYDVLDIDTGKMEKPGLLVIKIQMGKGNSAASFDLFPGDVDIPSDPKQQEQLRTEESVAHLYDVPAGHSGTLIYPFTPGDKFKLGATGNWFSNDDATNTAKIQAVGMDYSATIHEHAAAVQNATIGLTSTHDGDREVRIRAVDVPTKKNRVTTLRRTFVVVPKSDETEAKQ